MTGGSLIRLAACPLQDARMSRRLVIRALVDDAGGLAASGKQPKVRAYPGEQGLSVAASLRAYASSPDVLPDTAAFFSKFLPVVDQGMAQLIERGEVPCLLVGTYDVVAPPDDVGTNRPAEYYDANGDLLRQVYLGGAV